MSEEPQRPSQKGEPLAPELVKRVHAYWKEHRPKNYRRMEQDRVVHRVLWNLVHRALKSALLAEEWGLDPQAAFELVSEELFPPTQEEQPNLGHWAIDQDPGNLDQEDPEAEVDAFLEKHPNLNQFLDRVLAGEQSP